MKLLITGGCGFIGSNFIQYWLEHHPEDSIINFDALTYAGNAANVASVAQLPNYQFIHGSITDREAVKAAMTGVDVVVHFAAESHVDNSITNPLAFVETNVLGTAVLLDAARQLGIKRFHHVSTDEVFGTLDSSGYFHTNSPYDPRSPYSASKAGSDHLVRAYYHTYGLPITISNCSNNYGYYQFPEKFLPVMIINLLQGKKIPVYGDGSNIRDWLHVIDHVRGIEAVLAKGVAGETYLFGGGTELSNLALAQRVLQLMGKGEDQIEFVADRQGHDWRYAIDASESEQKLGWKPQVDFTVGLQQTVDWYKANEKWWQDIRSGAYRVKQ
jgi:dTDP-glucose 4,6-dehydratase